MILERPKLRLFSVATVHDRDGLVFLLGEKREGAERERNLWVGSFGMT